MFQFVGVNVKDSNDGHNIYINFGRNIDRDAQTHRQRVTRTQIRKGGRMEEDKFIIKISGKTNENQDKLKNFGTNP